jgi:hypothetical protein
MVTGVVVLSALTVFLSLCERDHSLLLSAASQEQHASVPATAPRLPVVSADTQPAPDSITRVTVPTAIADPPVAAPGLTSGESNASVARTHTERIGFTLARSNRFQRIGPVSVGVWKVDSKHKLYDVSFLADGRRIDHNRLSLYLPVSVSSKRFAAPLQFVVSAIDHNRISGYIIQPAITR